MNPATRNRLLAAIAAVPLLAVAVPTQAQTRVNQDGGALDANTRVGGNRSNAGGGGGSARSGRNYTGNQVVTGNVTGGKAFRGNIDYGDPGDFRGFINRPSDRLNRDASRVPTRSQPQTDYAYDATAYYGAQRAAPPPVGFQREGFTSGYINTGVGQTTTPGGLRNPVFQTTTRVFGATSPLLRPSDVVFDGGVNQNNEQTFLSASPLYGVRRLDEGLLGGPPGSAGAISGTETFSRRNLIDRYPVNRGQIEDMQREMNGGARGEEGAAAPNELSRSVGGQSLGQPIDGAANQLRTNQPLTADRLSSSGRTSQSQQRRLLVPPAQQSKQYEALQQRFQQQRQGGSPVSDVEANRQIGLLRKAQGAEAEAGEGGKPKDGAKRPGLPLTPRRATPGGAAIPQPDAPSAPAPAGEPEDVQPEQPAAPEVPTAAPAEADEPQAEQPQAAAPAAPIRVKSLAEGVEAKGLRDVLASAEELMRAGKFASAIEKYGTAQQVAPNNPLIQLGRAHAELGATYYGRAEQSLRQAVEADPALLMGQYDLETFMGRDRLAFLVKDLKQIAQTEAGSPRPMLLLAYIAYNTSGSEGGAAGFLDAAAERARKQDPLIELMRKHWSLSADAPAAETPAPDAPESTEPDDENK